MDSKCFIHSVKPETSTSKICARRKHQKKIDICRGEVIKEKLPVGQCHLGNAYLFGQSVLGKTYDSVFRFFLATKLFRRINPTEVRVKTRSKPRQHCSRLQFLPGVSWKQFRMWKVSRDPQLDGDIFAKRLAVGYKQGHFVLWIDPCEFWQSLLLDSQVDSFNIKINASFGQCNERHKRTRQRCVAEVDLLQKLQIGRSDLVVVQLVECALQPWGFLQNVTWKPISYCRKNIPDQRVWPGEVYQ